MKNILLALSFLMLNSCQNSKAISDEEVMTAFNNFFKILDRDLDDFNNLITDDFFIFENSRRDMGFPKIHRNLSFEKGFEKW